MSNPNAVAAAISGGVLILVNWILANYTHVHLSETASSAITAAASAMVLYVGRDGIKGAALRVWQGATKAWNGPAKKK